MKKLYWLLRGYGYVGNLVGLALFVAGRRGGNTTLIAWGGGLIITGLLAFVGSYATYLAHRLTRR